MSHKRGKSIVVTEPDLIGGDRVVLVDDRHDAKFQQPKEGALGVAVLTATFHLGCRQQHLPHRDAMTGKRCGVLRDEHALPY